MGRAAAQVLAVTVLMARVMVVAVLVPASRVTKTIKVIRMVTINNLVRGVSNSSNLDISHPKQLNSGQYHVFTTSLCKQDQKLHKRAVNAIEPAILHQLSR